MQSLKLRGDQLNNKEHDLRQSLANFEKYINVRLVGVRRRRTSRFPV